MKTVHLFTDDELRVVREAHQKFTQTIEVIAKLHGIEGPVSLAPDLKGLMAPASKEE